MSGRVAIVDDDQSMCEMIEADLKHRGFGAVWYTSAEKAFLALKEEDFDVVLTDLKMPGMDGIELCDRIASNRRDIPVVVITAFGSLDTAVSAIRAGAYDFVTKPIDLSMLALTLERAIHHHSLQEKVKALTEAVEQTQRFDELLGTSAPMQRLYDRLRRISDSEVSILITGESGTGKELVARALHKQSRRNEGPFIPVNCAAFPETLLESELFGHAKGAFTGARETHKGLFVQAENGTLLLDEIGDVALPLQPKLLRALEDHKIRAVGGDREVALNVRVLAATNRDLESAVEEGRFREDLLYRLNVIQIAVPPLRSRGTDILLLAQHFLSLAAARSGKKISGLSEAVAGKLLSYQWPGNVRELRNAMEHAVALTSNENLVVEDLPDKIRSYRHSDLLIGGNNPDELSSMEEVERQYVQHVLKTTGGNRTLAAQILGFDRKTLYRKLVRYENLEGK